MKYINNFEKHNEGIGTQLRKLGPGDREKTKDMFLGRAIDDIAAKKVFKEIKEDFEKYNKDLRKTNLYGNTNLTYYMGEFNARNNSPGVGNHPEDGHQKVIKVSAWKGEGLELNWGRIEIDITTPNTNPDEPRSIDSNEEFFKISYDIAKKMLNYFYDEFNKQYPQLKGSESKNNGQIKSIENGEAPTLGYIHATDKKGERITYNYKDIKDKDKMIKYIVDNVIITGRNYKQHHITYFTEPGESEDLVRDNVMNMETDDVDKQNLERVYK